jgi:hypothetical protein
MIPFNELERNQEAIPVTYFTVQSWNSHLGTEEKHENIQSL